MTHPFTPGELRETRLRQAEAERGMPEPPSLAQRLARLGLGTADQLLDELGPAAYQRLLADWRFWGRPTQFAPEDPDWVIWLLLCGRGWGKTRTGAEWVRERIESGEGRSIALIGPTLGEVWKQMVYGTADAPGLVRVFDFLPHSQRPEVRRNDREIHFHTGAVATIFTAEEPELRGPNLDTVWCDELAKWRYLVALWDNLEMTLRAPGASPPRIAITTTPRPLDLLRALLDDPDVRVTWGNTFANAGNLHGTFVRRMVRRYAGTRTGLQELFGTLLGDNPDALFHWQDIEDARTKGVPALRRIVVAVDPATTDGQGSDETGIVVVGVGFDDELYVLDDLTSVELNTSTAANVLEVLRRPRPRGEETDLKKHTPEQWGDAILRAYRHYKADAVVIETNKIGQLAAANIRAALQRERGRGVIPIVEVNATRGKAVRADPVATLYRHHRVHHVQMLAALEREITEWNPRLGRRSPNRLDALCWGIWHLANLGDDPDPLATCEGLVEANRVFLGGDRYPMPRDDDRPGLRRIVHVDFGRQVRELALAMAA